MKKVPKDVINRLSLYAEIQGEYFLVEVPEEVLFKAIEMNQQESSTRILHMPAGLDKDIFGVAPTIH